MSPQVLLTCQDCKASRTRQCLLLLRLAPVEHGMPRGYVPDNHMVRNALGMAQDKDPVRLRKKMRTLCYYRRFYRIQTHGGLV